MISNILSIVVVSLKLLKGKRNIKFDVTNFMNSNRIDGEISTLNKEISELKNMKDSLQREKDTHLFDNENVKKELEVSVVFKIHLKHNYKLLKYS